jgi:hypothetical protein
LNVSNPSEKCDDERFDCVTEDCINGQSGATGMCYRDDRPYRQVSEQKRQPDIDNDREFQCQEEDDFCGPGCESPSVDCIDDVNIESGDSKETATGKRAYNPNGQQICGNEETGEE